MRTNGLGRPFGAAITLMTEDKEDTGIYYSSKAIGFANDKCVVANSFQ
jgi:hypothetical protein